MQASFNVVNRIIPVGKDILRILFSKYLTIGHMRLIVLAKIGTYRRCASIVDLFAECNLLQQLKEMDMITDNICRIAAAAGHLDVIIWATNQVSHFDSDYMTGNIGQYAAKNGHLHILKWLYINNHRYYQKNICKSAAEAGHLHIIKWACDNGYSLHGVLKIATKYRHQNIITWMSRKGS